MALYNINVVHDHEQQTEALTQHMDDNTDARDQLHRMGGRWNDAAPFVQDVLDNDNPVGAVGNGTDYDTEDPQIGQSSNDEDSDATIPSDWQVAASSDPSAPQSMNNDQQISGKQYFVRSIVLNV